MLLNDLTRVREGIWTNGIAANQYLGLTGSNVLVNVNDTGIDATRPDLMGRVFSDVAATRTDTNGHGTHVGGIIASSGLNSGTARASGSETNANFRGKAPAARLFALRIDAMQPSRPLNRRRCDRRPHS